MSILEVCYCIFGFCSKVSNILVKDWLLRFLKKATANQYSKILVKKGFQNTKDLKDAPPTEEIMLRYGLPDDKDLLLFMKELSILCDQGKELSTFNFFSSFYVILSYSFQFLSYQKSFNSKVQPLKVWTISVMSSTKKTSKLV